MGINPYDLTDDVCIALMHALEDADFEVSDWEASFIDSNLTRERFTVKQKESCVGMINKYDHRLEAGWRTFHAPQRSADPVEDDILGGAIEGCKL